MEPISVSQAFSIVPPRRRAVLCKHGPRGSTDLIATQWFTWLNIRRQPMISFALERAASLGLDLEAGDELCLAFLPSEEVPLYNNGIRTAENGRDKALPAGAETIEIADFPLLLPSHSEVVLRCTLAGAYNYPFKKVRIFNCNLEDARGEIPAETGMQ